MQNCKIGVKWASEFTRSILPWVVAENESLKMSTNVKRSEAMNDKIITAMSRAWGASIFLFELFKKKHRKHLLSLLRNEPGLLVSMGFNNMMHALHIEQNNKLL